MKTSGIYVDIESLFDLRQGLLGTSNIDIDTVTEYLLSEEYNFRETDHLKYLEPGAYKAAISNPKLEILEASTVTRILLSLQTKIDNIESRNKYYNETSVPEIILNVYPFVMSEEQMTQIRDLLFFKLGSSVLVNVVNFNIKDISPLFFKTSSITAAFIYDMSTWLSIHASTLENNKIHDTLIYFPAVYSEKPSEEELTKISKLGFKDPMSYTEYLLSPVASINFLPIVFYSNVVTAVSYLNRFEDSLKKDLSKPEDEGKYDDLLSKVQVP